MTFNLKKEWGDHKIFTYDTNKHKFIEYLQKLYDCQNLDNLHFESEDFNKFQKIEGSLDDRETDLHKIFYNEIKKNNEFKKLYCDFIKDIYQVLRYWN